MTQNKQHLELLISSQEAQKQMGNLTPIGIAYLDGLKRAKTVLFGEEAPNTPAMQIPGEVKIDIEELPMPVRRYVNPCPNCKSSNVQDGPQFHKCHSCGTIFT